MAAQGPVIVGSATFPESMILATIYAHALRANQVEASTKLAVGSRETYLQALRDGQISAVPEYTGNLLAFLDPESQAKAPRAVEAALPAALGDDLRLLTVSKAEDADVYAVTAATEDSLDVSSLADLAKLRQPVTVGGPPELAGRTIGPTGLRTVYRTRVTFVSHADVRARARALKRGDISVAAFTTTDASITDSGFVVLDDPSSLILPQFQVPLVRREAAARPEVTEPLNAVSAALTTADLAQLTARATANPGRLDAIAKNWLTTNTNNG